MLCVEKDRKGNKKDITLLGTTWLCSGSMSLQGRGGTIDCPARKMRHSHTQLFFFNFKSCQYQGKREALTADLIFESGHIPVSVFMADTMNREPEHISDKILQELLRKFWEAVVRRGEVLRADIHQKYLPEGHELLPKKQRALMQDWCNQIPVVRFNCSLYDLNMIKTYFVTHLSTESQVVVAQKQGKITFISTPNFKFLDITNYLGPGTSYAQWVKMYAKGQTKSWLPYKWFTSVDQLDCEGLLPYCCWYSRLKNKFVLSPEEFVKCQERGMKTLRDWLQYYNNLDLRRFLEAVEKM